MEKFEYKNIKIINSNCLEVMPKMQNKGQKVDIILTSPPYNTSKKRGTWSKEQKTHYDIKEVDSMTDEEYINFSVELFNNFDNILKENGVVLYNISYSTDKPMLMWDTMHEITSKTNFMIADTIIWKKKSALPNNMSHNRMTRICEFVFVLCRKDELKTFKMNKEVLSIRPNGIKQYTTYYNFIEAKNNDGSCDLNKATYSSDFCKQLLQIYAPKDSTIFDPFMGTGTTAVACQELGLTCWGTELSKEQCEYAIKRISKEE